MQPSNWTSSESSTGLPDGQDQTISSTDYAKRCRELMALYRDLNVLGAKTVFDLPRVVVIGGQSSGKSSLVEAVSGINVPRDSGTCTRCPMVCTMSSDAASWWCTVEIQRHSGESEVASAPMSFGPTITNKSEVEIWIRRAQAAVLSPHRSASDFVTMSDADLRQNAKVDTAMRQFSKDVVQVNVYDPEATDLAFVDLPGLIQNAAKKLISTVRSLVESYVKGQNTLIVIAMPMNDDIEMMQAVVIAREADPDKERTIGVLTKPDTLTKGASGMRDKWRAVLEGRDHPTTHGYYCVRLADDDERAQKITAQEALHNATQFFNTTAPWSQMDDRSRFGIPSFVSNISALLVGLIEKNLPDLRKTVEAELLRCNTDLATLPPLSDADPSTEIILRVNAFCKDVSDCVRGLVEDKRFVHRNKARYVRFKDDILDTTPDLRPFESKKGEHNYTGSMVTTATQPRWLQDVRMVIKRSVGWELPGEIPFEATRVLIMQYTGLWPAPSKACFEDVAGNLGAYLEDCVKKHFGQFKYLEKYAGTLIRSELESCVGDASMMLNRIVALESHPLFTQNFEAYSREKKKWLEKYEDARHPAPREVVHYSVQPAQASSPRAILHTFPDHPSDSEYDTTPKTWSIEEELRVIATVQAYFQVAHQRIIDCVPLAIEHELNYAFTRRIDKTVLSSIFKDAAAGIVNVEDLLQEDPAIAKKRKNLRDKKERLVQIKAKLDMFKAKSGM